MFLFSLPGGVSPYLSSFYGVQEYSELSTCRYCLNMNMMQKYMVITRNARFSWSAHAVKWKCSGREPERRDVVTQGGSWRSETPRYDPSKCTKVRVAWTYRVQSTDQSLSHPRDNLWIQRVFSTIYILQSCHVRLGCHIVSRPTRAMQRHYINFNALPGHIACLTFSKWLYDLIWIS